MSTIIKYCECGCGKPTKPASKTRGHAGHVKGEPTRFLKGHRVRPPLEERYKVDDVTGCWVWQMYCDDLGYGRIRVSGDDPAPMLAHRHVYEVMRGPIPDGLALDHLCRNPSCVNPDHLEPVTHRENLQRGGSAKLNAATARWIFLAAGEIPSMALADIFGVGQSSIWAVWRGRTWRNVNFAEG